MNKNLLSIAVFSATIFAWQLTPATITSAKAETEVHDDHGHDEQKNHDQDDGHGHDSNHDKSDGDDHNEDHSEEGDNHDEHGHGSHQKEDSHDDHGHGDDSHSDEGDEHEEGKTEITPDSAKKAGIVIEETSSAMIAKIVPLTGRITINQNAKADVRGRFSGIVRSVKVNLGDQVQKGQILAVVESNESLNNYNVTAPIDGTILERNTNLGDVVNDQPLFIIADLSSVWAKFHIFPKDADMINVGQTVRVHTLDEGKENNAAIKMLFPTADALSQTLIAVAPIGNEKNMWRPGMTVEGDVTVSEKKVPLAVRESALQTMEDQIVVFVQEGDSYEMKPVKTGVSDGRYIEITNGLIEGQSYVSEGSFVIKADILKSGAAHEH
jgi:cobalt-zinc-cadmium efflux system membrane fusion protein